MNSSTGKALILMGVMGVGKTTIGTLLANRLGFQFIDADDHHSIENKSKLANGIPLTDADRLPWLKTLNQILLSHSASELGIVMACSALKEEYRMMLAADLDTKPLFILLEGSKELIEKRLGKRAHFADSSLLESQISILEKPNYGLAISVEQAPLEVVGKIEDSLKSP